MFVCHGQLNLLDLLRISDFHFSIRYIYLNNRFEQTPTRVKIMNRVRILNFRRDRKKKSVDR